jgi:predicted metal-dependent hydrolase
MEGSGQSWDYGAIYRTSLQVNWQIEDIIGGDRSLDFATRFLPDAWVEAEALTFLSEREQLAVNHVRAHSYLHIFGFAEEYFLPFVLDHVRARIPTASQPEIRALLHFAEEESKHIELFQRFSEEFRQGFGTPCEVIGPARAVAEQILALSPLGIALSVLALEWMTQVHYVATIRNDHTLDAQFCSLLRHHWVEEAQHTKLDTAIATSIAGGAGPDELAGGVEDLLTIMQILDTGFAEQVELDLAALTRATGRQLSEGEEARYRSVQRRSYRKTFLTSGMRHKNFRTTMASISPSGAATVAAFVEALEADVR